MDAADAWRASREASLILAAHGVVLDLSKSRLIWCRYERQYLSQVSAFICTEHEMRQRRTRSQGSCMMSLPPNKEMTQDLTFGCLPI